jgi:aminopeptidase YwaD
MRRWAPVVGAVLLLTACSGADDSEPESAPPTSATAATTDTSEHPNRPPATADPTEDPTKDPIPWVSPGDARVGIAMRTVRYLANEIGPRPGHTEAYFEAADWVQEQLEDYGWEVTRQRFPTPAGVSWGIPVDGGPSINVIATRGDVKPGEPWLAVGAHLDTVPQAPGAEDNASGIGSLLAIAAATEGVRTRLPLVLIAFGSEEPRGEGDEHHHYGSRAYVADLTDQQRETLRGMVAMDRVGVGDVLPISSVEEPSPLRAELAAAAERAEVATLLESDQRSSDHWSFVSEGLRGVRLGGTSYGGYHSAEDTPDVVNMAQLERTIRTVLAWVGQPA